MLIFLKRNRFGLNRLRFIRFWWSKIFSENGVHFSGYALTITIARPRLGSTEAVKRAVAAGLGASLVLACAVEQEVRDGRLCALALDDAPLQKSLRLVWRNDLPDDDPLLGYLVAAAAPAARA